MKPSTSKGRTRLTHHARRARIVRVIPRPAKHTVSVTMRPGLLGHFFCGIENPRIWFDFAAAVRLLSATARRRPVMKKLFHLPRDWMRKVRRAGRQFLFRPSISREGILKLRLAIFLEAILKTARSYRVKVFQLLYPSLSAPCPASSPVICEINSLADFQSSYGHLAAMLGHPGKAPPPSEIEFLRTMAN